MPVFAGPLRQRGHLDGAQAKGDPPALPRAPRLHQHLKLIQAGITVAVRPPEMGIGDGHLRVQKPSGPLHAEGATLPLEIHGPDDAGEHRVPLACHGQADVRQPRLRIPGRHKRPLQAESRPALQPHGIPDAPGGDAGVLPAVDAVDDHAVFPALVVIRVF